MTQEFTHLDVYCSACEKFLERFEDEQEALDTGVMDPDTGQQDQYTPTLCEQCGEKFKLQEKLTIEGHSSEYIRSKSVIGTIKIGENYFMYVFSRQKLREDGFPF